MSDSCNCINIKAKVMMDEPKIGGKLDFDGKVIFASDGEDYKRGYDEGHALGFIDGRKDGYQNGYDEGHKVGYSSGYDTGKTEGLTEGYDNGYALGKADGYKDGYDEGYFKGYSEGYKKGKAEGGSDDYYNTLWDTIQNYGNRVNYNSVFASVAYWNEITFKPKYDMEPTNVVGMFSYNSGIQNLKQILEDCGVVLDTSKCTNFNIFVQSSKITHLPCISLEGLTVGGNTSQIFTAASSLVYIDKIITRADVVWYTNAFNGCSSLTTIAEIEGEIGTSFNISACPLLDELTIDNIVNAYADMTGQTAPVLTVNSTVKAKIVADDEKEDTDTTKRFWLRTLTSKNVTLA